MKTAQTSGKFHVRLPAVEGLCGPAFLLPRRACRLLPVLPHHTEEAERLQEGVEA